MFSNTRKINFKNCKLGMTRNSDILSYSLDGKLNQKKERKGKMDKISFFQVALKRRYDSALLHHSFSFGVQCQFASK